MEMAIEDLEALPLEAHASAFMPEIWTGSFEQLPSGWSGRFDLAWSQEALCHSRDKPAALCEARRVLHPGGMLVFTDILHAENAPAGEARVFSEVNAVVE